jgi:hypothetical protein
VADKWLFLLTYVTQNPIQAIHGQLCGMSQAKANTWMQLLPPVLNQAFADHDLLPARTAEEVAARLATTQSQEGLTSPLLGTMVLNGQATVRKTLRNRQSMTVARRRAPRSNTSV